MGILLRILAGVGLGAGVAKITPGIAMKALAGGIEVLAAALDVCGYLLFISFILGWKKGGEKVGVIWPLSIILEVVSQGLWKA